MKKSLTVALSVLTMILLLVTPIFAKNIPLTKDTISFENDIVLYGPMRLCNACGNGQLTLIDTSSENERFAYDRPCEHQPRGYDYFYSRITTYYYKCYNCGHTTHDTSTNYRMECHGTY